MSSDDGRPLQENIVPNTSIVSSELSFFTTSVSMYRVNVQTTTRIFIWKIQWSMCNLDHLFIGLGHSFFKVGFGSVEFTTHVLQASMQALIFSSVFGYHNLSITPFNADITGPLKCYNSNTLQWYHLGIATLFSYIIQFLNDDCCSFLRCKGFMASFTDTLYASKCISKCSLNLSISGNSVSSSLPNVAYFLGCSERFGSKLGRHERRIVFPEEDRC